jgi:hypothetical protein
MNDKIAHIRYELRRYADYDYRNGYNGYRRY